MSIWTSVFRKWATMRSVPKPVPPKPRPNWRRRGGLLAKHHAHHLQKGTIGLPNGTGGWVEIDNAAEYGDSALYAETVAKLGQEEG